MRQAIQTKFHGPTNTKGSRYSATCEAGRIILRADHRLNFAENHIRAARTLAEKLGWDGVWRGGGLPGSSGYAFVQADSDDFIVSKKLGE